MTGRRSRGQTRWGRRVRKQARKEIVKLAESKRFYVFNEGYITLGAIGTGDNGTDTYISNALGGMGQSVLDAGFTGNEILDPLVALRITVRVNYGALIPQFGIVPPVRVTAYLVALNDQIPNSSVPRITAVSEDTTIFVRHPDYDMRWMLNSQNVTVIRKKTVYFTGREITSLGSGATTMDVKTMKLSKRLRGKKVYEQTINTSGAVTTTDFLKGWNYYWFVVSQVGSLSSSVAAVTANPIRITADRFVYFKDF